MIRSIHVLVAAGGTGGHIFPGLAVGQELASAGHDVTFAGTRGGMEADLVARAGFSMEYLTVGKLKRMSLTARLKSLALLPSAISRAIQMVTKVAPDVVVGAGGYVAAPIVVAAWIRRIPVILLEQNAIAGATNRHLARLATKVVIAFDRATERLPESKTVACGNPVRRALVERLSVPRRPSDRARLLVLGGSQGARALNDVMVKLAPVLGRYDMEIRHQTGRADFDWVQAAYRKWNVAAEVLPFIEDMASVYEQTDLVLCRAGATTIAELTVAGLPSLLVPFPYAADDHQNANAAVLADAGAAVLVPQRDLTVPRIEAEFARFRGDGRLLERMGNAAKLLGKPDAAACVVTLCHELAGLGAEA